MCTFRNNPHPYDVDTCTPHTEHVEDNTYTTQKHDTGAKYKNPGSSLRPGFSFAVPAVIGDFLTLALASGRGGIPVSENMTQVTVSTIMDAARTDNE